MAPEKKAVSEAKAVTSAAEAEAAGAAGRVLSVAMGAVVVWTPAIGAVVVRGAAMVPVVAGAVVVTMTAAEARVRKGRNERMGAILGFCTNEGYSVEKKEWKK